MQLLGTITDALQIDYLPGLNDLINNKNILSRWMERNETDFDGETAYIAMHTGRNQGIGARIEGGVLPIAQKQIVNKVTFFPRNHYGRFEFSGIAKAASRGTHSYASVVDLEMMGLGKDLARDTNRILFGNGTGRMCPTDAVTAVTAKVKVTCTNTQNLRVNMVVDIIKESNGDIKGQDLTISAITKDTDFTVSTAVTTAATGDNVYRTAARNAESYGIQNIFDTSDPTEVGGDAQTAGLGDDRTQFGNLTYTGNTFWQGQQIDKVSGGSAGAWDASDLQKAEDDVDVEGVGEVNLWLTTYAIKRFYGNQLTPDKRFAGTGEVTLDGGYRALEFNGNPLVPDRDCLKETIYGLDVSSLVMFQMGDWNFMDEDGSILARKANQDAFEGTMRKYFTMGCKAPKGSIRLVNCKEST